MSKVIKFILGIILLLISIQFLYAGFQYILPFLRLKIYAEIILGSVIILLGILLLIFAIFIFLNKKWVKIPLNVVLGILLIYFIYELIHSFYLTPSRLLSQKLINWQIFLMIEYIILDVTGIILNWKNKL